MGRIKNTFRGLQAKGEKALVTFITAGDPDLEVTAQLVLELEQGGADIIELGVPFSDPMADGPTIQLASERALAAGATLPKILAMVRAVRQKTEVPLLLMGYYNPVFIYGVERFCADAAAAGVDGLLLVDLPPEEAAECRRAALAHGIDLVFLLTPTSDEARIAKVAQQASGFIYYVSVTGVTGARSEIPVEVFEAIRPIKEKAKVPVVVGFGISTPEQAGRIASVADGVVVGSALVKLFEDYQGDALRTQVRKFVAALKAGMGTGR